MGHQFDDPELIFVSDLGNSHLEKSEFLTRSLELSKLPIIKDGKIHLPEDFKLHAEGYIELDIEGSFPVSIWLKDISTPDLSTQTFQP